MPKIFLSYRRDDSRGETGRLATDLTRRFGDELVFRDIEDLAPGVNFPQELDRALAQCEAMIVMIGPRWATDFGERLAKADDFVRLEVASGLARADVLVIPVLVGGARMPGARALPESLADLANRNALELTETHWDDDVKRLGDTLAKRIGANAAILPVGGTYIPFALTVADAEQALSRWLANASMAAPAVRSGVKATLTPIYVPYWTSMVSARATYEGEAGEKYQETEQVQAAAASAGEGQPTTTRQVARMRWSQKRGQIRSEVPNEAICAWSGMPAKTAAFLSPAAGVKTAATGHPPAPQGTRFEVADVRENDFKLKVNRACEDRLQKLAEKEIRGTSFGAESRNVVIDPRIEIHETRMVLVPGFQGSYQHNGKTYDFTVNAADGTVEGGYPLDARKAGLLAVAVILIIASIAAAWFIFAGRSGSS